MDPATLAQLDQLVRSGRYANRTAAIEAAVERLAADCADDAQARPKAFEESCGALSIGITPASMRAAEMERLGHRER